MDQQPVVVFITTPTKELGRQIAQALLSARLAACVNILGPVNSLYTWEGQLQDEQEYLLLVKTWSHLFETHLLPLVQSLHPYQVPEIIALPLTDGLPAYLHWMLQSTQPST